MKTALVGLGYWGPNLLRVLNKLGVLVAAFDLDEERVKKYVTDPTYQHIFFDTNWERCLGRRDVDAVIIATPPKTHYEIAMKVLEANKHVFIEKPMTTNVEEAEDILSCAKEKNLIVMVGHTFLYTSEVRKIKEIVGFGELGNIQYIHASRLNLGKFQKSNVVADLAPHDISIFNYLIGGNVKKVFAQGYGFINKEVIEVAFVTFEYNCGAVCHLHLSWLDPKKCRTTTIVGTKKMLVYDMLADEKIKVYDKGVDFDNNANKGYGEYLLSYRHGDIWSPSTEVWEPLGLECEHFIECIEKGKTPLTDGKNGLAVVKILNASLKSLKTNKWEYIK